MYKNFSYSHFCFTLFNFFNETDIIIILNNQGGVRIGVTRPEPTLLPFWLAPHPKIGRLENIFDGFEYNFYFEKFKHNFIWTKILIGHIFFPQYLLFSLFYFICFFPFYFYITSMALPTILFLSFFFSFIQ